MWNSWHQRLKQLSEIQATGIAYFVLDKLGDKVAGPFADARDARARLLSLPDGEFQVAQEYWGPSVDILECADDGRLAMSVGPLAKFFSRLIRGRLDLRGPSSWLSDDLDKQHMH